MLARVLAILFRMLAWLVRAQLALELLLYAAAGAGVAASIAFALLARLALVCSSSSLAFAWRSPRAPHARLGLIGTIRYLLGEWRAMLADNFFYLPFEALAVRPDTALAPGAGIPVILVHGYLSNRGIFSAVVRALDGAGVRSLVTFNFRGVFSPVEPLVAQLEARVAATVAASGEPRVVLVCHSMGGLVARAWMARYGAGRVAKLVTIATPHHGTALARLGVGANAAQMRRGSAFLEELARKEGDRGPGCAATSIYTTHDNLVAPQDTSRLPWARNIAIAGLGHVDILLSGRLHRALVEELREAGVALR